jgi:hypothetical protein
MPPTAVTPVWQRDFQFQTQVSVTVASATLGTWTGRRLTVERQITGTNDWRVIPLGTAEVGAAAGTFVFYDTLPAVNRQLQYRASTTFWNSLYTVGGGGAFTSVSITTDFVGFVLRDPLTIGSAVVLRWLGDMNSSEEEVQGSFRPLAGKYPVIVSDQILGRRWQAEVRVKDTITEQFMNTLRSLQTPLVLQTDMTDRWYWVRIGPTIQQTLYRQTDRRTDTKREQKWVFDLIEVQALPGQPQVYF